MAAENLRHIPLEYSHEDSQNSALRLILALRPEWEQDKDEIEFVRFTEGITNTVRPGHWRASLEDKHG
jgi:ethanolamine kinase